MNLFLTVSEAQAILASNPGTDPTVTYTHSSLPKRTLRADRRALQSVASQTLSDKGIVPVVVASDDSGPPWLLIAGGLLLLGLWTRRKSGA